MSSERAIGFSMLCWTMLMLTSITLLLQMQRPKPQIHSRAHRDWSWWSTRMSYANTKIKRKAYGLPRPLPPRWPRWSGQFWMLPMEPPTHGRVSGHVSKKALKRKNMKSWNFTCNSISSQLQWNCLMMRRFITGRSRECALTHFLTSLTWNTLLPGILNQLSVPKRRTAKRFMVAKCSKPSNHNRNAFWKDKTSTISHAPRETQVQLGMAYEFFPKERAIGIVTSSSSNVSLCQGWMTGRPGQQPVSPSIGSLKMIVVSDIHRSDQQRLKETLYTDNFELSLLTHLLFAGRPRFDPVSILVIGTCPVRYSCTTALLQRDMLTIVQALLWILPGVQT